MNPKDVRACPDCGGLRYRKAKRCRSCAANAVRGKWRVADPGRNGGHRRARALYPELGVCEHDSCEAPATDRHHIDGNTLNNERANLAFLCRRHHMEVDGRLRDLAARASEAGKRGGWPKQKRNVEQAA